MTGDVFIDIGIKLLAVLLSILVTMAIEFIRRKLSTITYQKIKSQLETKQGLAWTAVTFVEQVYEELDGEEKYAKAVEWLTNEITEIGLSITTDQIKGLIESAVKAMKEAAVKAA